VFSQSGDGLDSSNRPEEWLEPSDRPSPLSSQPSGGILLKSELLKAIQSELSRHDLDTFIMKGKDSRITVPGCPTCKKQLSTVAQFVNHLNEDVLPSLLNRLSQADNVEPPNEDYINVDYWADPDRKIRRRSGDQDVILAASTACSKAEWMMLLAGLGMIDPHTDEY
jgi:hypothetical protein